MSRPKNDQQLHSRRALLKSMGLAPLLLRPAGLFGASSLLDWPGVSAIENGRFPLSDLRLTPHYPSRSPLADVLKLVAPGSDEYGTERYAFEIGLILTRWSQALKSSVRDTSILAQGLDPLIEATTLKPAKESKLRSDYGVEVVKREFAAQTMTGRDRFVENIEAWFGQLVRVETAEFEINGIEELTAAPLTVQVDIRYDVVGTRRDEGREERVGSWRVTWRRDGSDAWKARQWVAGEETTAIVRGPVFIDVTQQALDSAESYRGQLLHGADYWRTVLDGAIGVDVYGNNGVAAGDFDNDGRDDLYICQPSGLPNRLYRNRGDGTFEDVTERAGVGVLDNTACALFADFDNKGRQDLLVVCGSGPMLYVNQGDGTFAVKRDAFKFANPPQGTFTHAAVADYDRDGRLDIYFCMYMYYLGLDQYHYPIPYFDARNGPPNCLFHNEGNGTFIETTAAAGLNADNDRYSFACAWGESNSNGLPDLFVANDFGSSQLYRNQGDGTFKVASGEARIEEVGAGMSCAWSDFDNDGHQDIYVTSMWEASGQRVSEQKKFHEEAPESIRRLYQRHARGNALYRNQGDGTFRNVGKPAAVEMGRWSWSADFWDFDHDGFADLYVTNGYISATDRNDLASFFWRQVVGKSPNDATPSLAYEHGWNGINELIRSDSSWNSYARNVMFANNRDGTFSEVSGPLALDFLEDSRTFVLADMDGDGRLEVVLKNRNAPQVRVLHNAMKDLGDAIALRLRGHTSNRDAIGAAVTIEAGALRQTRFLQAGTGFLAQHSKELFFGLGKGAATVRASIRWPSGLSQQFEALPVNHRIEIEEGSPSFSTKAFGPTAKAYAQAGPSTPAEVLPSRVETWLIDPLKAPDFSLPDLDGRPRSLSSMRGGLVLVCFWSSKASACRDLLRILNRGAASLAANRLNIVAINVEEAGEMQDVRSFATSERLSIPVLLATEEVAGIYNIIYRHLFDRRRELGIPTSFLVDGAGMIVKVYQGLLDAERLLEDVRSIPATTAERIRKALPFAGVLREGVFQRNEFTYGVAMFQHGYLEQAAESFRQVIAANPDNPEGYYNLGTLSLRRNDFEQARAYLGKALKLKPNYPEAWNNLGMMAAQQGRADEAIENFQRSLQLRPGYAVALLNLGNVYRRQKLYDKAEDNLKRALAIQPDDPEIVYSLGMLYAQQGQLQTAAESLQKAIDLRPEYPEALNNLGVVFVRQKEFAKAEELFKTGIRVSPRFDQSYLNLARLYAIRSDRGKARDVLNELLRLDPANRAASQALEMLQSAP